MDMALDEVIRQESSTKRAANGGGNRRRGARSKNSSGGARRQDRRGNRQSPYARSVPAGNSDEPWTHDLYEGKETTTARRQHDARSEITGRKKKTTTAAAAAGGGAAQPQFTVSFRGAALAAGNSDSTPTSTRITVSNLHYDVTRDDLIELFGQVGTVKRVYIHYDKADRSLGVADITFEDADSARRSIERYDKVTLDGQPMHIAYYGSKDNQGRAGRPSILDRLGEKVYVNDTDNEGSPRGQRRSSGRTTQRRQQGRGKASNQQRRRQQPEKSAEELDRELDGYMQVDTLAQ
ncbi:hypothetical protein SYNPS1DRAFT_30945 [Syncephalis pseudoplumigaleata]|uniref:RRM domain-containing protein n=1 Tax=Syncephalis pseudoplumigaleata TaxID=1712513 RepID=A0A4P9YU34_9FUNG|nr:hypothetical protein SYNPS1DRAFT_30945 [Syncephalis pseudoplumigaleata]|eukprot:RKP23324.1 hypothetical protein SYNPS1DRAFT_30945 [Syncephalis pseudoplumigaleata]